ncbi:MAG: phenylacetate--CoA ligase [Oscillospiraceae bacterium]|nr:phenylacetate--CoA ligase [Oscillospiraceae bacterium]
MAYHQREVECMPYGEMKALQSARLVDAVGRAYGGVARFRELMGLKGLGPGDVKGVDDLCRLPFTEKSDLRDAYPYGMLAVPIGRVVQLHSTSGTTGKRTLAFYTERDLDKWADCCARAIRAAGGGPDDVVQISYGYGLFTGGEGLNAGSRKVGCLSLPMSSGNTERQIQFMEDLGTTILCCTPSYAAYLAEALAAKGALGGLRLKVGIFGAEAWSEGMRVEIERALGIKALDIFGLAEIMGPGVSFECLEQSGMHVNEDHFLAEVVDPVTLEQLPYGSEGELVLTCLTNEALPFIRYRTRDICVLTRDACPCGRTLARISRLMGRSDDMLIVKGINVFPSQIESVLIEGGMAPNYQIIVDRLGHTDSLEVRVEMTEGLFDDTVKGIKGKEGALAESLRSILGISAKVTMVAARSIERSEGKAVRVIDRRKL